jgi:hypothetical protein
MLCQTSRAPSPGDNDCWQAFRKDSPRAGGVEAEKFTNGQDNFQMELGNRQVLQGSLIVAVNPISRAMTQWAMSDRLVGGEMDGDLLIGSLKTPALQTQVGLMGQ